MATHLKSIGLALLLGGGIAVPTYASPSDGTTALQNVQQNGKPCSGVVVDDQGQPVIGASVAVKGTNRKTITDIDGHFTLPGTKKGDVLEITYIGFDTKTVRYQGAPLNISMKEDTHALNEVVVTGYGGQQKRGTLTTAISKMDDKVLENAAFANVGQALQGSVTGLQVTNTTGSPGSSPTITLRGGASITSTSSALVIVDGVVRDLSEVNSEDIESIEVLKDAASTAIYGARANGGVILITTKKGKAGRTSITYKTKIGANFKRNDYDYLNAHDYIYYNRLGWKRYMDSTGNDDNADGQFGYSGFGAYAGQFSPSFDCLYYGYYPSGITSDDEMYANGWQLMDDPLYSEDGEKLWYRDYHNKIADAVFRNTTLTQDHHIGVSGGNDAGTFAASLGYYNEDGIVKTTSYKRFTGSINGSYKIRPNFTVNGSASLMWSKQPTLYTSSSYLYTRAVAMPPTWNPFYEDGSPAPGLNYYDGNMLYWMDKYNNDNSDRTETFTLGFDWYLIPKKLKLTVNSSLYYELYQLEGFNKAYYDDTDPGTVNTERYADASITKYNQIQLNAMLNYTDTFADKHNLDAMVGAEYYDYNSFALSASTKNSPTDDIPTLNVGVHNAASSSKTGHRIESLFGRVNYNYMQKYLLSLTMRYDGISRLKDHRWGVFPGVSAGWNIVEEDFWKDSKVSKVISNLKPRLSYGVNGNVNGIGDYYIYGKYTAYSPSLYKNQTAYWNSTLMNTKLRWEQSKTFEGGLDIGFFNNRLSFILDYYVRNTSNLITSVNLPAYTGFSSITTNLGSLRNQGFEMEMRANIINQGGFRWDLTANLSTVKNTITQLPTSDKPNNYMGGVEVAAGKVDPKTGITPTKWVGGYGEGGRLDEMYGYHQQHIFRDWDDVKANANMRIDEIAKTYGPGLANEINPETGKKYSESSGWKALTPGDVCWEDVNGDGKINSLDRKVLGHYLPTVTGGFSTTLAYKGLSLYARFDYALGHKIWNMKKAYSMAQSQGRNNNITEVKKMWSEDNPTSDYPMFTYADQLNKCNIMRDVYGTEISSRFLENGNYLALREITLSYTLPKTLTSKIGMRGASLYVTGQNLFYITKYSGSMPEARPSYGEDEGTYPTPKTVLFGVSFTF